MVAGPVFYLVDIRASRHSRGEQFGEQFEAHRGGGCLRSEE